MGEQIFGEAGEDFENDPKYAIRIWQEVWREKVGIAQFSRSVT